MKNPKVSVIIPAYNAEKTIKQCLNSVLNQTYDNYEVIAVNNNSTDRSKKIIEESQKNNRRIKYILEKRKGRGSARNAGIRKAKGSILVMTDSDCMVPKDWIERLTKPIRDGKTMASQGFEADAFGNFWSKQIQKRDTLFLRRNQKQGYITHIDTKNFAIKTKLMKKYNFDPQITCMEDLDLYVRIRHKCKVTFLKSVKVKHFHRHTFLGVAALYYKRGLWVYKVYSKYKKGSLKEPMFESLSMKNFFTFPFWLILQFINKPLTEAIFITISELSWRTGIGYAMVSKRIM